MKVTLRNRKTGAYLTDTGRWVSSGLQAKDFRDPALADEHLRSLKRRDDIGIYCIFDDSRWNHWCARENRPNGTLPNDTFRFGG